MDDNQLQSRLERLGLVLEKRVNLRESTEDSNSSHDSKDDAKTKQSDIDDTHLPAEHAPILESQVEGSPWGEEPVLLKARPFDDFKLKPGEQVDEIMDFCPWKMVKAYLYNYIGNTNRPRAKPFFDKILDDRRWDFFYLHDPKAPFGKPYLFVPTAQFEKFLEDVNKALCICLRIPGGGNEARFYLKFSPRYSFQPRFLKQSHEQSDLDIETWPEVLHSDITDFESASVHKKDDWEAMMQIVRTGHKFGKKPKFKSVQKQRQNHLMMSDLQNYLGLKQGSQGQDIVFVCTDVEALEQTPNPISEIGFAILDTRDISGIEAGPIGQNWRPFIMTHHLRVREYSGLRNYRYVKGCPDNFDFGTSTFPKMNETRKAIMDIFEPFTAESRSIALVGHDIRQDVKFLATLDVDLLRLKGLIRQFDSQALHRHWTKSSNGRGLHSVLNDLEIASKNLHNAGNDAYYTLWATVALAVKQKEDDEKAAKNQQNDSIL